MFKDMFLRCLFSPSGFSFGDKKIVSLSWLVVYSLGFVLFQLVF